MESKRLIWGDSLKGLLIILVVLGHSIQYVLDSGFESNHLFNLIYSFHMPAFMATSGYFFCHPEGYAIKKHGLILCRRFRQLFIPFLLWTLLLLFARNNLSLNAFVDYLIHPGWGIWFLWVLFFINLLFLFGQWISKIMNIKQEFIILSLCLLLVIIRAVINSQVFGLNYISYYFLYYTFGYYLHKYYNKLITRNITILSILTLIWFFLAWHWKLNGFPSFIHTSLLPLNLIEHAYKIITAGIAIYVLFSVAPSVLNNNNWLNKPSIYLGTFSLGIYTAHFVILNKTVDFCLHLNLSETLTVITTFSLLLLLSWLLVRLLNCHRVTSELFLGKI